MSEEERIKKDLILFEQSLIERDSLSLDDTETEVTDLATGYFEDTNYYLKKAITSLPSAA